MAGNDSLEQLADTIARAENIAVLTGAGMSADSGIPTFRGKQGLWKQYRAEDLATPGAFERDPLLVWEWYAWRRGIIGSKSPNPGHIVLAGWEKRFPSFHLITQNIDGLHYRAGSRRVLELHGNIWRMRCTQEGTITEEIRDPLSVLPPRCPSCGAMMRPHVVWFGESLDMQILNKAFQISSSCGLMLVIGTSALVQPAASLPLAAAQAGAVVAEINPDPTPLSTAADFSLREKAGKILPEIETLLKKRGSEERK